MENMTSTQLAQLLYVAYYGRPADASGLTFWAEQIDAVGVEGVAADFGASAEFEARFGDLTNEELVQNLYQQLFGRDGEQAGVDYWVNLLENGTPLAQIAIEIANGAQNDDVTAINNKVAVAQKFTDTVGDDYAGDDAANYARDILKTVKADTEVEEFDVDGAVNNIPSENLFTLAEALEAETLPEGYEINTVAAVDAGVVNVADATAAFNAVAAILEGAANAEQLAAANLFTWTVEDTLANLQAADAAVLEGAESYSLTETELTTDVVTSDVAGLEAAVAEAGLSEAQQAIVDGAANAADVTVAVPYTLEDTLANLEAADATVLEGATSYSLTNEETDLGSLTEEQIALVEGADNAADFTFGVVGGTFSLTAEDAGDIFVGTANNDTFTAESGALNATSVDGLGGNDTLNATYKNGTDFAFTPTIRNVENINVNIDAFDGTATTFDATNVRGANIALSSTKLGFNGTAGVLAAAANSVTAGENVTDLTVAGLTTGTVDAGAAETVVVTGTATDAANVAVNGNVDLTVNTSTDLNIEATEDSVVTLTSASVTSVTGSGEGALTVTGDLAGITDITGVDTAVVTTTGNVATDWDVNSISVNADVAALTVADDANVSIDATQTTTPLVVTGQGNTGSTVNVTSGLASVGSLTFASLANANVNLTAAASVATLVTGGAETTVNVAGETTIATLTATGDDVIFTGEGDVTVTAATDAASVDASGLTGALDLDSNLTTAVSVSGASGDNVVDLGVTATGETASYVGQSGNDTVTSTADAGNVEATFAGGNNSLTANALNAGTLSVAGGAGNETISATGLTTGTVAGNLGGGDDTLTLGDSTVLDGTNATTIAVDFGAGNDTLVLGASANLTAASFNVVGLENITVNTAATFTGSQLTGDSYNIAGTAAGTTLAVTASSATGETIDLSGIMLSNIAGSDVALTLTGAAGNDTLIGTSRADSIVGGAGADTMTGGAGADTFTIATDAVTAVAADVVTDFGNGADLLSFGGVAGSSTNYTEATAAVADFAAAKAAADAALTSTTAAEYNVQQVGSDVWVFHNDGGAAGADNVVKLTGVALDGIEFADIVA